MVKYGSFSRVVLDGEFAYHHVSPEDTGKEALLFCYKQYANPHFPTMEYVGEKKGKAVYKMERLWRTSGDNKKFAHRLVRMWDEYHGKAKDATGSCEGKVISWEAARMMSEDQSLPESIRKALLVIYWQAMNYNISIELSARDILQREDGTLVFIDPFYDERLLFRKRKMGYWE